MLWRWRVKKLHISILTLCVCRNFAVSSGIVLYIYLYNCWPRPGPVLNIHVTRDTCPQSCYQYLRFFPFLLPVLSIISTVSLDSVNCESLNFVLNLYLFSHISIYQQYFFYDFPIQTIYTMSSISFFSCSFYLRLYIRYEQVLIYFKCEKYLIYYIYSCY